MRNDTLELVRGSDNPFRDVGLPDAETKLLKADLSGKIIDILDKKGWSQRQASQQTGINQADICRIRKANLKGFTIDRLVKILHTLHHKVEVTVRPVRRGARILAHAPL
ncbi:MAG: XRE family transcriptional regulator [Nitrospirales bacterium]|nr:XRE family transcriptional regulator [Nitrospirales bacterium]NKB82829.1 XRE family transcriptional regulator [Nitrospirales bacterium]